MGVAFLCKNLLRFLFSEDNPGWEEKQHRAAESQQKPQLPPVVAADEDNLSEVSASAAKMTNDGKNPLLEYAIR